MRTKTEKSAKNAKIGKNAKCEEIKAFKDAKK